MGKEGIRRSTRGGYAVVLLIPARTDTTYFHDYIYGKAEIRFVRGRLRFTDDEGNASDPAPFPSMVVIYNGETCDCKKDADESNSDEERSANNDRN